MTSLFAGAAVLVPAATLVLVVYLLLALPGARRETVLVVLVIAVATGLLVATGAAWAEVVRGLGRTLLFAALLPTLRLLRETASRLAAVAESRRRLAALPGRWGDVGISLGSHVFGAMLNTGAFALMSTVVAPNAAPRRRRAAAEASLRGMNVAILWSPFFVGFAVASTYVPGVPAWQVVSLGMLMAAGALLAGFAMFVRPLDLGAVRAALVCLRPLAAIMIVSAGAVVTVGLATPLSTLQAVLVVMPVLSALALRGRPGEAKGACAETWRGLGRMGDDLLLITAAMTLGTVAEGATIVREALVPLVGQGLPAWGTVALLVVSMLGPAMVGVHPMITGSVMLATVTGLPREVSDLVLLEAMLLGWALGSMVSLSSLSVVTSGAMYRTPPLGLAYGPNLLFAAIVAAAGVTLLGVLDFLLRA